MSCCIEFLLKLQNGDIWTQSWPFIRQTVHDVVSREAFSFLFSFYELWKLIANIASVFTLGGTISIIFTNEWFISEFSIQVYFVVDSLQARTINSTCNWGRIRLLFLIFSMFWICYTGIYNGVALKDEKKIMHNKMQQTR